MSTKNLNLNSRTFQEFQESILRKFKNIFFKFKYILYYIITTNIYIIAYILLVQIMMFKLSEKITKKITWT